MNNDESKEESKGKDEMSPAPMQPDDESNEETIDEVVERLKKTWGIPDWIKYLTPEQYQAALEYYGHLLDE